MSSEDKSKIPSHLLLQGFLDQCAAVALSQTLRHRCVEEGDRIARIPEYICCEFEMQKGEKAQNSPFLVLWRKLHVEEVAGQGSHHHLSLLTLKNKHCKLPHPKSGKFTWTM